MLSALCVTAGVRPFPQAAGRVAFLFICLPGLSLLVSAFSHWWCPPFSVGHVAFLFIICLPGLSLVVSALFRWRCNISIHLFPRFVTAVSALFRWLFCWPCSISIHLFPGSVTGAAAFSAGHVAFLFICLSCDFFLFAALVFSALSAGTGSPVKGSCYFERGA